MDIILSHYFSGEATKKELRKLDHWLAQKDENEKYFLEMTLLYQYVGQKDVLTDIDIEKALSKFKYHICKKQKNKPLFHFSYTFKVAAAVAILLISGFTMFYFLQPSKTTHFMAVETYRDCKISENINVTLFPGAEIVYNTKKDNKVQLNGKAVFTINNNSEKSLKWIIVQAGETYIKNLGTVFTVDAAQPDNYISVEVSEGEVNFYTKSNTGVHLKSNEKAVYNVETKQFVVQTQQAVEMRHTTSLQTEMVFNNTPLQDAINTISARYNVNILIKSESLKDIPLNVSFDGDESLESILDIIMETVSARVVKKDSTYVVTAK